MDHGFQIEHFELLTTWAGVERRTGDADQDHAYRVLVGSYEATARWARAVQARLFPDGWVRKLSKPTDQSQKFKSYTWARIYPRREAPNKLAYTVGIDATGEFVVKIDTVNQGGAPRKRYEQLSNGDYHLSPFAAIESADKGLAMSFEQLVDWSIERIGEFEPGYDALAAELGLISRSMRLVTDADVSRAAFARWRDTLLDQSEIGAVQRISGQTVWLATREGEGGAEVQLGLDPSGREWGVEINAPPVPGSHNRLSAIATDESGGLHLLRQGWLKGRRHAADIREEEFIRSTGLPPVDVGAMGQAALRRWFLVATMDDAPERIRRTTAAFAELCWAVRSRMDGELAAAATEDEVSEKFGGQEWGGTYWVPGKSATDAKLVEKLHGLVWETLATRLGNAVPYRKWSRSGGYAIDMEIAPAGKPALLLEIKTRCATSDVHSGVGQLQLYRQLFPSLRLHRAILLIDTDLTSAMRRAVSALDIEIHRYIWTGEDSRTVELPPELLALCGMAQTR